VADLAGVRWIGGGSGAGKSTVATLLGSRAGLPVVHTDLSLHRHAEELAGDPVVDAFAGMSMDERWVRRSPGEMLRTFPWFDGAGFDLLIDELPPVPAIVEGFRLVPDRVAPLLVAGAAAVWLLPSPAVRRRAFAGRGAEGRAFWERTSDPDGALRNLLERDRLFTERLRADCAALGLPVLDLDLDDPVDAVADRAARVLRLR
jgi:hypothetical protein